MHLRYRFIPPMGIKEEKILQKSASLFKVKTHFWAWMNVLVWIRRIEHKEIYFWPQYKSRYACWYRNTMNMISLNLPVRTLHFKTFNLLSWKISNLFGNLPRPIWCAVTPVFNECDLTDESTQRRLLEHDDMVISLFKKATLHLQNVFAHARHNLSAAESTSIWFKDWTMEWSQEGIVQWSWFT